MIFVPDRNIALPSWMGLFVSIFSKADMPPIMSEISLFVMPIKITIRKIPLF